MAGGEREVLEFRAPGSVTVDGIEVRRTAADMDDYEIVEAMAEIMGADGTLDPAAALSGMVTYCRRVLGPDYEPVKRALRAENGGRLPSTAMVAFCNKVMEALGAKN